MNVVEGRALVAALVLVHLDDDFLALAQQLADAGLVRVDAGLEVVAGDLLQRQEAVALGAIVDEGRLEGGFEPGDAALVDVGLLLFLGRLFDVDVVQGLAVHDGHAQFLCLRGIDQHSLHVAFLARSDARNAGRSPYWNPVRPPSGGMAGFAALAQPRGRADPGSSAATPRRAAGAL
jgi:hypothetical protein